MGGANQCIIIPLSLFRQQQHNDPPQWRIILPPHIPPPTLLAPPLFVDAQSCSRHPCYFTAAGKMSIIFLKHCFGPFGWQIVA